MQPVRYPSAKRRIYEINARENMSHPHREPTKYVVSLHRYMPRAWIRKLYASDVLHPKPDDALLAWSST